MSRLPRRALVTSLLLILVAAFAAVGCGGSSSDNGKTTETQTTASGGAGQTINGVECNRTEQLNYHVHAHLTLLVNGKQEFVPALIGIPGGATGSPECFYFLHTHDTSGVIHIEAPAERAFTLGQFFSVWGQPLSRTQATNLSGPLRFYVGKKLYKGDPRNIKLTPHAVITVEQGKKVTPPNFTFTGGL
jgi:hypothetical protein